MGLASNVVVHKGSAVELQQLLKISKDVELDIKDKHVLIIEDIVDSGFTLSRLKNYFIERDVKSVKICTFLQKPECLTAPLKVDYCAMEIPNAFIVGYGLDYDGIGRNYRSIYVVKENQ